MAALRQPDGPATRHAQLMQRPPLLRASAPARAPPRRASGVAAGPSSRARRAPRRCRGRRRAAAPRRAARARRSARGTPTRRRRRRRPRDSPAVTASSRSAGVVDAAHATAAAARRGLDQQRQADPSPPRRAPASAPPSASRSIGSNVPGTTGTPASDARRRAAILSPSWPSVCDRWSDEDDPRGRARLGQLGLLGQEAVARVDRLGAARDRGRDDRDRRAGSCRAPAPDRYGRTRRPARRWRASTSASLKTATDSTAQLAAGADDPHRDLAAVGDQEPVERRASARPLSLRKDTCPGRS